MRNWDTRDESGTDRGCEWERDWEDVQRVCRLLDLPCEMVRLRTYILPFFTSHLILFARLTCRANIGRGSLNLHCDSGRRVKHQTRISGVTGMWIYPLRYLYVNEIFREVKFGALMDTIAPTSAWLATGTQPVSCTSTMRAHPVD